MNTLIIHPTDNVAVALSPLKPGDKVEDIAVREPIPQGHKVALKAIQPGQPVVKYGFPIGTASQVIEAGAWVHTHNVQTTLAGELTYTYQPETHFLPTPEPASFQGFLREDGRAAVRNELWILPTVGCVNAVAELIAQQNQDLVTGSIEGLYAFPHPYGCSQMGDDHATTRRLLAALARHPNAGGVLVLGLGCENLTLQQFQEALGSWDDRRVKFLVCQEVADEYAEARRLLTKLAAYAGQFSRQPLPASKLVIGLKCGGSDGLSGVTANPAVGAFSDQLIAQGGSAILTEVPEMFGAETLLMNRCVNETVFQKTVQMVNDFKQYFLAHGQVVYENPSPGNKAGGITTLEDKSLGCVQKGGHAHVMDVLGYGESVTTPGLNLLAGPGNDLVSTTALTAAGAHLILFTTGRGTPFGAPAPTLKIATNSHLYEHKSAWMDFNAGTVAEGESVLQAGQRLMEAVLTHASGQPTACERLGARSIAIWKGGVTL